MEDSSTPGVVAPQSPVLSTEDDKQLNSPMSVISVTDANPSQCHTVVLCGQPIAALMIDNNERLCLAQISSTLLKNFSYNEIHNRRVALGITCVQCTPVQLEILRRAGAMPVSSRRCGMISKREAERLCKSFLCDNSPPKLPDNFAFEVIHLCSWGCRGNFVPSRYNSSRAKCIKCIYCNLFFSPNKFIFHSHRIPTSKYQQPDAANFNSWRRHIKLFDDNPGEALLHAWEDVKAMFNGGSRKRSMYQATHATTTSSTKNSRDPTLDLGSPIPKSSRLDLDPVINNLSLGRKIGYPIIPIPNRSFPSGIDDRGEKHDSHPLFSNSASVFRQFTQNVRSRTFPDLFWSNSRVPYPFPTGFWPKGTDTNFTMFSGAATDKKFSTPCCPLPLDSSVRFLGSLNIPTAGNMIDNERDEIREDMKIGSIPVMHAHRQDLQMDLRSSNKYTSAFQRVEKKTTPDRDISFMKNRNGEGEMPASTSEIRDCTTSSPRGLSASTRLFNEHSQGSFDAEDQHRRMNKEDVGESVDAEDKHIYVEKEDICGSVDANNAGKAKKGSPDMNVACDITDDHVIVDVINDGDADGRITYKTTKNKLPPSPVLLGETRFFPKASTSVTEAVGGTKNLDDHPRAISDIDQCASSTNELKQQLFKEVEERERISRECRMLKDSFEGFIKREMQYRQMKDQLCLELDQERKARLNTQQKLKEAQETLQEFSCNMLLSRHYAEDTRKVLYPPRMANNGHQ